MKTKTISGHSLTLKTGIRYIASRPIARKRELLTVTIKPLDGIDIERVRISDLTYRQANQLINAFNNGKTSFDGRIWK